MVTKAFLMLQGLQFIAFLAICHQTRGAPSQNTETASEINGSGSENEQCGGLKLDLMSLRTYATLPLPEKLADDKIDCAGPFDVDKCGDLVKQIVCAIKDLKYTIKKAKDLEDYRTEREKLVFSSKSKPTPELTIDGLIKIITNIQDVYPDPVTPTTEKSKGTASYPPVISGLPPPVLSVPTFTMPSTEQIESNTSAAGVDMASGLTAIAPSGATTDRICMIQLTTLHRLRDDMRQARSSEAMTYLDCVGTYDMKNCDDVIKLVRCRIREIRADYIDVTKASVQKLEEVQTRLIASEISNGKIDNAIENLNDIERRWKLDRVAISVQTAYDEYGKLKNFDNIKEFILALPTYPHKATAYKTLVNEMEKNNELGTSRTLWLHRRSTELCHKNVAPSTIKPEFQNALQTLIILEKKLDTAACKVMISWGKKILNADTSAAIIEEVNNNCEQKYIELCAEWTEVIGWAYKNDTKNAEPVLKFLKGLSCQHAKETSISAFYNIVTKSKQLDSDFFVRAINTTSQ